MAKLEIDLAPEEQTQLEQQAKRAGLPVSDWVRLRLLDGSMSDLLLEKSGIFLTTDDGEMIELPGPPAIAENASSTPRLLRPIGLCAGEFAVPDDFDDPLPDEILRQFEGR